MILSFIGMSGSGKSHWSARFAAELGYQHFCCDDIIEEFVAEQLDARGIQAMARWMGFPGSERFLERQAKYLELELQVMNDLINKSADGDIVIDTTGSVVYLQPEVQQRLKKVSTVVLFETPKAKQDILYRRFVDKPKPIIWGEQFAQKDGEKTQDAIRRCFPELLKFRNDRYQAIADVVIPYPVHSSRTITADEFLDYIKEKTIS